MRKERIALLHSEERWKKWRGDGPNGWRGDDHDERGHQSDKVRLKKWKRRHDKDEKDLLDLDLSKPQDLQEHTVPTLQMTQDLIHYSSRHALADADSRTEFVAETVAWLDRWSGASVVATAQWPVEIPLPDPHGDYQTILRFALKLQSESVWYCVHYCFYLDPDDKPAARPLVEAIIRFIEKWGMDMDRSKLGTCRAMIEMWQQMTGIDLGFKGATIMIFSEEERKKLGGGKEWKSPKHTGHHVKV